MTALCRSCGAEMLWAEAVPSGQRIPLDVAVTDASTRGALVLVNGYAYGHNELAERIAQKEAVSITRAKELIRARYDAHLTHFSTCPNADRHRKDRR